jgi:1-deoxy-D-xylulose-5-phosphate reductoisomerase
MKKKISILGSTGSIGFSTLKIIEKDKLNFKIILLSANKNFSKICKQIVKYKPVYFIINDTIVFEKVKKKFKKNKVKILNSYNFVNKKVRSDITIAAIPGIAGLEPTISLIESSKKILIANKESVICGWSLINIKCKKFQTKIIPIDSEHFSIFELLKNHKINEIKKIFLTASGGPFLKFNTNKLKNIQPKNALKHPKWKMGKKISIDSSTLMNKIFELAEAQKLFSIPSNKLDILIHPDSLVHAIIKFKNGITKFIYHETSMIIPLANAIFDGQLDIDLFFNKKNYNASHEIKSLIFEKPNYKKFPALKLQKIINAYPSSAIIVNAANEILVDLFLRKKIPFLSISKMILSIINDRNFKKYAIKRATNINQIKAIDLWSRTETFKKVHILKK